MGVGEFCFVLLLFPVGKSRRRTRSDWTGRQNCYNITATTPVSLFCFVKKSEKPWSLQSIPPLVDANGTEQLDRSGSGQPWTVEILQCRWRRGDGTGSLFTVLEAAFITIILGIRDKGVYTHCVQFVFVIYHVTYWSPVQLSLTYRFAPLKRRTVYMFWSELLVRCRLSDTVSRIGQLNFLLTLAHWWLSSKWPTHWPVSGQAASQHKI